MDNRASSSSIPQNQQSPGLLQHGQIIYGGTFIQHNSNQSPAHVHVCSEAKDSFQHLQAHVATSAFDSDANIDAPKCHPNTRNAVLNQIMAWIFHAVQGVQWMMWLNGAAGAGKSAIARSIVERCIQRDIPFARFFFFRIDGTRNTTKSLVATLAHQLIICLPDLRMPVMVRIQNEPLIFNQSLETQFQCLIFEPLLLLQDSSTDQRTVFLLFDGLDELSGENTQNELIRVMANFIALKSFPLIVFFGSRVEIHLKQAFASRTVSPLLRHIQLDNNYKPDEDIRLFLTDSLADITETHPHRHLLPPDWPAPAVVEEIVKRSSGQFIYASAVVKFISTPKMHPSMQLDIVRGLLPAGALTPFAQLDALYRYVFSQVESVPSVMYVLAAVLLCGTADIGKLDSMFQDTISKSSIPISLASLSSIITIEDGNVKFLHASIADFLLDHARSGQFYIDRTVWSTRLATDFTRNRYLLGSCIDQYTALLWHAQPTQELKERLTELYPARSIQVSKRINYLSAVRSLNFDDGSRVYHLQLKYATKYLHKYALEDLAELAEVHSIDRIMEEIYGEKGAKRAVGDLPV